MTHPEHWWLGRWPVQARRLIGQLQHHLPVHLHLPPGAAAPHRPQPAHCRCGSAQLLPSGALPPPRAISCKEDQFLNCNNLL